MILKREEVKITNHSGPMQDSWGTLQSREKSIDIHASIVMRFTCKLKTLVSRSSKIQKDQQSHMLQVDFQKNIVHDFEQGCLHAK